MSPNEVHQLMQQLSEHWKKHTEDHEKLVAMINQLHEQIRPVIEIYVSVQWFGNFAKWFAKWIFVPMTVIVWAILSMKSLLHK